MTRSAFACPLLSQLRPAGLLSLRHLPPSRGGNLPVARRPYARFSSGIGRDQFLKHGNRFVQPVECFLRTAAFSPKLIQHPTEIGHHNLRFSSSNEFKKALYTATYPKSELEPFGNPSRLAFPRPPAMLKIGDSSDENFSLSVGRHRQRFSNSFS